MPIEPDVCRHRFLSEEEAADLVKSLDEDENQVAARAILLLLLTGARRNEVTHAKWEQIDWQHGLLIVPRSKSGKARQVHLSSRCLDVLRSIIPIEGNPYVFPAPTTGRPSKSLHFPWVRIKRRAGLTDLRLHDLRHSFASFLANEGVSLYTVQHLLGHSNARYTQRYAHLTTSTLSEAVEVVSKVLSSRT